MSHYKYRGDPCGGQMVPVVVEKRLAFAQTSGKAKNPGGFGREIITTENPELVHRCEKCGLMGIRVAT